MTAHADQPPTIDGLAIETPGVRIPRTGEVTWRVRALRPVSADLPSGIEIHFPPSSLWMLWFFGFSSLSALVFAKTI